MPREGSDFTIGLGTLINIGAIIAGGIIGMVAGKFVTEEMQNTIIKATGVSTMFLSMATAFSHMLKVQGDLSIETWGSTLIIVCMATGALIGELLKLDQGLIRFGEWLKVKTGNQGDKGFVNAFVVTSLTVVVGAMAVVGSLEDGMNGDPSILIAKSLLDFIIVIVLTSSLGKGSAFSAIPVGIFQGAITLLGVFVNGNISEQAMVNLSMVGGVMIFCVGLNLVFDLKIRVANLLPGLILALVAAYIL